MDRRWLAAMVTLALGAALALALALHLRKAQPTPESQVRAACSSCHLFPPPEILPRSIWRPQIEHMAFLRSYLPADAGAARPDFSVDDIVAWYEERAPEKLPVERALTRDEPAPLAFERRSIRFGRESGPGVATVAPLGRELVAPNMALGSVHLVSLAGGPRLVGNAGTPVRVASGDLDADGADDLVIADLGNPMPTEDPSGRVIAALREPDGSFRFQTLLDGIGRATDARPFDLDGDGDLDVIVAAFGFLKTGGVYVLRNETQPGAALDFRSERVTDRTGAVSVIPVEGLLPGTGRGFVVALAQHHETVSLFTPREGGDGTDERVLYRAPHPNWGTSNLSSSDLDGDGDLDFLLSHGDTLDDGVAFKPYHGVEWLENRGGDGFVAHRIGPLYGAHAAEAGDLDGDGDLDVVAAGFLPQVQLPVPSGEMRVDSVIWFERDGDTWTPWEIESNHPLHTGMTLVDFDEDGRLDVVAAVNRAWDATGVEPGPSLEIWFNRGPRTP